MLNIDLFEKIADSEVLEILKCLGIKTKVFKKNSYILKSGDKIDYLGVILGGNAIITKTDALGKINIIEKLKINDFLKPHSSQTYR